MFTLSMDDFAFTKEIPAQCEHILPFFRSFQCPVKDG